MLHEERIAEDQQGLRLLLRDTLGLQLCPADIEITGNESKVEKFLSLMKTFGVLELTRTGRVAMARKEPA